MNFTTRAALSACALLLCVPAAASAKQPDAIGTQAATTKVPAKLTAVFPTDAVAWDLNAGGITESAPQSINVKSNKAWALKIFADKSPLASWDGAAYGVDRLANPLEVAVNGAAASALTEGTDAASVTDSKFDVPDNAAARAAGDAGSNLTVVFRQAFSYADAPGDYRTQVTYAATQSF
jgi:hypothetical protein